MQRKRTLYIVAVLTLLLSMLPMAAVAQKGSPPQAQPEGLNIEVLNAVEEADDASLAGKTGQPGSWMDAPLAPDGMSFFNEVEPNNDSATATALPGNDVVVLGNIYPNGDLDYFSFTGSAGDRVYAATMTSFSASGSADSQLELFASDGVTSIEFDDDDGSFGSLSSSIAGATLPADGAYYLRVKHFSATNQLRPYRLHLKVQSGSPVAETEPNDTTATATPLPASGWVSGSTSATTDIDFYSLTLNAGDTVYLSLDLDPERDLTEWNGQLGMGVFNNFILVVNDAGTSTPDSEAFFMTVKSAGTYYPAVLLPTGGTTFGTYNLSVAVYPASAGNCTTYTSTDVPKVIPTGPGFVTSNLTVPGNPIIADIDVSIVLTHTFMQDIDAQLVSPAGNDNGLFTDVGNGAVGSTNIQMDTTLDDEAGIPIGQFTVVSGMNYTPEFNYRLGWLDGEDAGGTWTLKLYDDIAGDGGVLQSWSVTICEPPPPPACPAGYESVTVYSQDFEASDGGYTHVGAGDEWEWGTPAYPPITTCASGVNCWATDLDNTYNASSNQDLVSPSIDLTGADLVGPATVNWSQRYQMESASFDHATVQVREAGGANPTTLWTWLDATMTNAVGSPSTTIQESAGWGVHSADISSYLGQNIDMLFHLDGDSSLNYAGLAIDDVSVTACQVVLEPSISLDKTVGTDPNVCAATDEITLPFGGGDVTYCYEVTNTGDTSFSLHDLVDTELGLILASFPYVLTPGASVFVTETANIGVTTVNTGTWSAYNEQGPPSAQASDMATVTVDLPDPAIVLTKTVGLDPNACATTDDITVAANTDVTYCYTVENIGNVSFSLHDLVDSELGLLLASFPYVLTPGASAFLTATANIAVTTVNTGTWSAYNVNGPPSAQASDVATVTVSTPLPFVCNAPAEGFENGVPPAGWSVLTTEPNGPQWTDLAGCGETNYTNGTGDAACVSSDIFGSAEFDTSLVTPLFDLTGYGTASLNYTANYQNFAGFDFLDVDISTDGGATWVNLLSWNEDHGSFRSTPGVDVALDLSAYAGQSGLMLRYRYYDPNSGDWDWYAQVDDVALECSAGGDDPNIFVDPLSMASTQATNTQVQQTLTISNTGGGTLNWVIDEENLPGPDLILPTQSSSQHNIDDSASKATQQVTIGDNAFASAGTGVGQSVTPDRPATPDGLVTITHSLSQSIIALNSVSCNAGTLHTNNSYMRVFDLAAFGLPNGLDVTEVEFGIEQAFGATGSQPVTVNLYVKTVPANPLTFANLTLIGTAPVVVTDQAATILTVPVAGSAGAGSILVVEVFTPNGQAAGNSFFIGSNNLGQTAPSYLAAADCGVPEPTDTAAIGFPGMHIVMNVTGDVDVTPPTACTALADIPWLTLDATNGANAGGTDTDVTVTFDSTGYGAGTYTGNLCVGSDDPDPGPGNETDLVIVPVTMTVETVQNDPNIYVDPLSMDSTQATNVQMQQTLTISNTGGGTLNWIIDEEDTTAPPFGNGNSTPDPASVSENASDAPIGTSVAAPDGVTIWRAPDVVLFDNGPLVNSAGTGVGGADESVLQSVTLLMNTLGFGHQISANNWVADDFTVSDAGGWNVDTATFFAYQTGSSTTSTMNGVNWIIYDGDPSGAGAVVASGSGLNATAWSNIYRVTETTTGIATDRPIMADTTPVGVFLPAGTYWIAWQTGGTLASGPWAPPITINGQTTTGNGLQSIAGTTSFAPALDGVTLTQQGFPFILEGTVGGGGEPCELPSDIPWLTLDATNGSNGGGTATDVTVTFDSTGYGAGVYTGNLCVTSNDPDAGPGNGTDLVIVPVTLTVLPPTAVALTGLSAGVEQMPAPLAGLPLATLPAAAAAALGAAFVWRRRRE